MIAQTRMVAEKIEKFVDLKYILGTEWTKHVRDCMGREWQKEW